MGSILVHRLPRIIIGNLELTLVSLARVLRYLATRHMFREVTPDVFTNNRVSSTLIKRGKTVTELQERQVRFTSSSVLHSNNLSAY